MCYPNPAADSEQDLITEVVKTSPPDCTLTESKAECKDSPELMKMQQILHSKWPNVKKLLSE